MESSRRGTSCHAYSSHRTNKKCDDQTVYREGPLSLVMVGSFLSFVVTMKQVVSLGLGSKHRRILFFEKFHVSHQYLNVVVWQGTVEERMEAVQARKQRLISGALTDQEVRTARIEELKMLFT